MKNYGDFTYNNQPFTQIRKFGIVTLTDESLKDYCNKESYTHKYLYDKHLGVLTEAWDNKKRKEQQHNTNSSDKKSENNIQAQTHNENNIPAETPNEENNTDQVYLNTTVIINKEPNYVVTTSDENIFPSPYMKTVSSFPYAQTNRKKYFPHLSSTNKKFKIVPSDNRYKNDYNNTFNSIKKALLAKDGFPLPLNRKLPTHFKYTQAPRIEKHFGNGDSELKNSSSSFTLVNNNMLKSVGGYQLIDQQNEKIKRIIIEQDKLPVIKQIANQRSLQEAKVILNNTKFMGEKYNPNNFDFHYLKSTTKRNVYGSKYNY